jgi:hypothetical protein
MKRYFLTALFLVACAASAAAQIRSPYSDTMIKRCLSYKGMYSSFAMPETGDLVFSPCPDRANIFNNTLQVRKNSDEYFPYAQSIDIINELTTTETFGRNVGSEFNINSTPFSYSSSFTNANFTTRYKSPNRSGAVLGLFSSAMLLSEAPVHDIQGVHGEAIAVSGSAASGLYGGVFNVGLFGGVNHGDISDLTVGASTVRDTDVRNYYRLWIKKPTISNAMIRDGKNYSIYQEGRFGSEFQGFLYLNNGHANSSGAAVSPLQIKLANAQTAEALTVRDINDIPLFSVSAGGQMRVVNPVTPSSSSDACAVGTIAWDVNNIYVCVAANTWRKSQLSAW